MAFRENVQIVIPTFNSERTIEQCLKSVLRQSYRKWSLMIVDNNSSDRTVEICKKTIFNVNVISGNFSRSEAYNFALKHSKAKYFAFVDSDCVLPNNWLAILLSEMKKADEDVGAVGGFYKTPKDIGFWAKLVGKELETRKKRMKKGVIARLPTGCLLIKREMLEEIPFDEDLRTAEETDWGYRLASAGYKMLYIPEADVWHYHRNSVAKYFKQQFLYGYRIPDFYLKNRKAVVGDQITSMWMNLQPIMLGISLLATVMGFPHLLLGMFCYWIVLSLKNKSLWLWLVYSVRCFAWTFGLIGWMLKKFTGIFSSHPYWRYG